VTPRATPAARLLISGPGGFKQEVALSGRTYRLGRDPQNEIVLPDETKAVSRVHAELKCDAGRYLLNDLDSQNGLLVGGRRKTSVQLQPGVAVKIGEYTLTLSAGPAASGVRTTQTKPAAKALRDYVAGAASQIAALWPPKTASQWATVVGIPLLAIIGLVWIASRDSTSDDQTRVERQEDPSVPETTTTIPPEPSAREKSLAAIRKLLEGKDFAAAAREAEQLLTLNPQDPEALALRDEANAGLRRPDPPTPPPTDAKKPTASARSARGSKPPPPPVYQPVIPRRAGETEADWFARDRRLTATAASAMQAMDAGDAAAALKLWRSIQSEEPGYPGLDAHIAAARARLSQAAQAAIQTARALEKSGDLPGARDSLRRARELDPESTAAQAALDALADRMRKEGERAFRDGQDFENYQKLAEARQAYQKAFDYLPDGHADKKRARAALDRIRK
jgi:pSer/pThr/pTyr-binding forkhead associated (FHA) protein